MSNVLEQALEALEWAALDYRGVYASDYELYYRLKGSFESIDEAIAALKEAIKQQGEPVAWLIRNWDGYEDDATDSELTAELAKSQGAAVTPLCTSAPTIPEGWQLVPIKPTPEMINAGMNAGTEAMNAPPTITYKAMLSAAPKGPQP